MHSWQFIHTVHCYNQLAGITSLINPLLATWGPVYKFLRFEPQVDLLFCRFNAVTAVADVPVQGEAHESHLTTKSYETLVALFLTCQCGCCSHHEHCLDLTWPVEHIHERTSIDKNKNHFNCCFIAQYPLSQLGWNEFGPICCKPFGLESSKSALDLPDTKLLLTTSCSEWTSRNAPNNTIQKSSKVLWTLLNKKCFSEVCEAEGFTNKWKPLSAVCCGTYKHLAMHHSDKGIS